MSGLLWRIGCLARGVLGKLEAAGIFAISSVVQGVAHAAEQGLDGMSGALLIWFTLVPGSHWIRRGIQFFGSWS